MKILILGATGMVGHILFYELRKKNVTVDGIGRKTLDKDIINFDLFTDWEQVKQFLKQGKFDLIVNCSAILVNESNSNKLLAVFINSYLPHCLADLFNNTNTKIIHLSTGGVFSGNDEHNYEDCITSPQSYYGITKAAGEFVNDKDLVVRSDFWGFDSKINGTGIFNWFLNQNGIVNGFSNVFFNGISNLEFSKIFLDIINYSGIIHIGSESNFSKGKFLHKVKEIFKLEHISLVQKKNIYKNIFLKSKYNIPKINNLDTMLNDVYCYLLNNQQYYNNIYPHIYKEH